MRKREFAGLKPALARLGVNLIRLPGRSLKWNPLQLPKGVEISDWVPRVADMLIEVFELPSRASKLLQVKLFPLYRTFKKTNESPTLFDLFNAIKNSTDSNFQARTAILDSLEPVLLSLGPGVLAYRQGWSTYDLAKYLICFEFAGLSEIDKNLLLNSFVLSEFTSRISRGISNPIMDLYLVLDEAQRICSGSAQSSAIANQIGLVRGTGIGIDFSTQSYDGILAQFISNTATKILGRCGSGADYAAAGKHMGLNAEQIHWAQMNLEPGLFVGQLGQGSWRYPFVFRVPQVTIPLVTHPQTGSDTSPLDGLKTVYAQEFDQWGMVPEFHSPAPAELPKDAPFANDQEYRFCKAVADNPMKNSTAYAKLARVSPKSVKQIRQQLLAKRYIAQHTLDSAGQGRSSLLLEILPEGTTAIANHEKGATECAD